MKRIFSFAVAALLLTTSCSKESAVGIDNGDNLAGGGAALSFSFDRPIGNYTTYAIATDDEWAINTMDIYVFEGGILQGKLNEATDYDVSFDPASHTSTLTMKSTWLAGNVGQTLKFYFVANDQSGQANGAPNVATTANMTEAAFKRLVTKDLVAGTSEATKFVNLKTPLLFSGDPVEFTIPATGKISSNVTLKRRTARFDVVNTLKSRVNVEEVIVSGANRRGYIFADAGAGVPNVSTFPKASMEKITASSSPTKLDFVDDNGEFIAKSAFYLYPTDLRNTEIVVAFTLDNVLKYYVVKDADLPAPATAIEANKRYKLITKPVLNDGVEFIVVAVDYEEGKDLEVLPVEKGVARKSVGVPATGGAPNLPGNWNGDTYFVAAAGGDLSVVVTSTAGTTAAVSTLLGSAPTFAVKEAKNAVTYGLQVEQEWTITVPAAALTGLYDVEVKFTSKNDATKSTAVRIVRMDAPKAVAGILAFEAGGAGLNLDGKGKPLFFKWGSLVGVDATKPVTDTYDNSDIIYRPTGFPAAAIDTWAAVPFVSSGSMPATNNLTAGTGDPCKLIAGYRMPTGNPYQGDIAGLSEAAAWKQKDGMFGRETTTGLFYPAASNRNSSGVVYNVGRNGDYWSSTPDGVYASSLNFSSTGVSQSYSGDRSNGFSVRCVEVTP